MILPFLFQFGTFLVRESVQGLDGSSPVDMQHTYTIEFVDDRGLCKKLKIMQSANKFHFKDFPDHVGDRFLLHDVWSVRKGELEHSLV